MMRAETPAQFATALRWLHVPVWVLILSLVGFVRLHLRAGRPWLAWTICAVRTLALLLNFLVGQNLNYREVTGLRHIPFLGESVSSGVGVSNPCDAGRPVEFVVVDGFRRGRRDHRLAAR